MDAAAEQGINAIWVPAYKEWISMWNEYKDHSGKLETWIGQPDGYNGVTIEEQITACARNEGKAVCIQGMNIKVFAAGRFKPEVAFPYVIKAIRRKDGLCVGVYNPEQLVESARFVCELS